MNKTKIILMAIGGGELPESEEIINEYLALMKKIAAPKIVVMTVATNHPDEVGEKYVELFKRHKVKNVDALDVTDRQDAFDDKTIKKVEQADSLFFTGGNQLHVTSLLGATPLYDAIQKRRDEGLVIAGTSAGAAMNAEHDDYSRQFKRVPALRLRRVRAGAFAAFRRGD